MKIINIFLLQIVSSKLLYQFFQLRDEELSKESQASNWFSASSALRVYGDYLNLDRDHNGMLSKEELSGLVYSPDVNAEDVYKDCIQNLFLVMGQDH